MLGKLQAGLRVQSLQLLLGQGPLGFFLRPGIAQASAPFNRVFKLFLKIHGERTRNRGYSRTVPITVCAY